MKRWREENQEEEKGRQLCGKIYIQSNLEIELSLSSLAVYAVAAVVVVVSLSHSFKQ